MPLLVMYLFFFFKQKTAYEMRISDWSSDVCSSDLLREPPFLLARGAAGPSARADLVGVVALHVEQGREVGIVGAVAGGGAHLGLAVIGDADAGGAQHVEVIGAVADRAGVEGNRALRGEIGRAHV